MFQSLYKYLILNSKAALPGIGVFYIRRLPAYLDFSNKTYIAPSAEITFTESSVGSEQKFFSFLAKEQHIEEPEAIQKFNQVAQTLSKTLELNGRAALPGLGVLLINAEGVIQFQQAKPLASFYEDIAAERTIREVADEEGVDTKESQVNKRETASKNSKNKKDYWWVFAIILAVVSIAAIIFYYYQNASLR